MSLAQLSPSLFSSILKYKHFLGLSHSISGYLRQSRAIFSFTRLLWPISGYPWLYRAISGYPGLSWAILISLSLSWLYLCLSQSILVLGYIYQVSSIRVKVEAGERMLLLNWNFWVLALHTFQKLYNLW